MREKERQTDRQTERLYTVYTVLEIKILLVSISSSLQTRCGQSC